MQTAVPATLMRGGTSRGLYIRAGALPADTRIRDRVLLAAMGSPDKLQIDGIGGAHPLTSKVAIVTPSQSADADVDYLFLQVAVDSELVSDSQNCGNILAGVGPFAIQEGMVPAKPERTDVRIRLLNSDGLAVARVETPDCAVTYDGDTVIDGVPGTAAPVTLDFKNLSGSTCRDLLPTGNTRDLIQGVEVTCIDNGMPVVVIRANDLGVSGHESPGELEANQTLCSSLEAIRVQAGVLMHLGDVSAKTVPKMSLVAAPRHGGIICTRTFIPHRVHESIGVFAAVSVATACLVDTSVAASLVPAPVGGALVHLEHPSGSIGVEIEIERVGEEVRVTRSALLRTARMIMQGKIFVARSVWDNRERST